MRTKVPSRPFPNLSRKRTAELLHDLRDAANDARRLSARIDAVKREERERETKRIRPERSRTRKPR